MENLESTEILERLAIVNKEIIIDIEQIYKSKPTIDQLEQPIHEEKIVKWKVSKNIFAYFTEKMNNQDFVQRITIVPIVLVELYRVMVSSFLILFVPQKCGNHTCQLSENLVLDSMLYNAGLVFNFITTFFFVALYFIEIKRENRLITYLEVNQKMPSDNDSVGKILDHLPIEKRTNILYLDKAYQRLGYFVMGLFIVNTILSGFVVFSYYLDNQTTTTYITNIILMITKLGDIYTTAHTDKNIFYSSYLKGRIQFNDVDPDKKMLDYVDIKDDVTGDIKTDDVKTDDVKTGEISV